MKLVKVKGIIIKEINYNDNDKIITILTDDLGKVSCMAKGSKKINSPILANSQYLVYSEFVLYKGSKFYYVNSADLINTFYKLRTDYDKLLVAFELTKILYNVTDENQDTKNILQLFLNTIHMIETSENSENSENFLKAIFEIKLLSLLGFSPRIDSCSICKNTLINVDKKDNEIKKYIYYEYINNYFFCEECFLNQSSRKYIKISYSTYTAIKYVINSDIKKIFNFKLKNSSDFETFGKVYLENITKGI